MGRFSPGRYRVLAVTSSGSRPQKEALRQRNLHLLVPEIPCGKPLRLATPNLETGDAWEGGSHPRVDQIVAASH
eukprot:scaffold2842_cov373-Prasinococcus_capsulatus_cf.AAC.8